jgi:hypothetical protein
MSLPFFESATVIAQSLRGANEEGLQLQLLDGSGHLDAADALSEFGRARKAGGVAKENQFGDGRPQMVPGMFALI